MDNAEYTPFDPDLEAGDDEATPAKKSLDDLLAANADLVERTDPLPADMRLDVDSIPMASWSSADYEPWVTGESAAKLASSAVAPLVAAARGFRVLSETGVKQFRKDEGIKGNTSQSRRISRAIKRSEVLLMPWFSLDAVIDAPLHLELAQNRLAVALEALASATTETRKELQTDVTEAQTAWLKAKSGPVHTAMQVRPAKAEVDENGRERKYEFITDQVTPIGIHPATPISWCKSPTMRVMIAEGMLKGDSALTGMLLAAGVTRDELASPSPDTDPRALLAELMERVPEKERFLILGIAGVYNWRQHPEWMSLSMKDRAFWIAFDGDTKTNVDVWNQANALREYLVGRKAEVFFLSPEVVTNDRGAIDKTGIDDYLASIGSWKSLISQVTTSLGPRPERPEQAQPGDVRVTVAGTSVQECVAVKDEFGNASGAVQWKTVSVIGGRILSIDQYRHPSEEEKISGRLGVGVDSDEVELLVEVEVSWDAGEGRGKRSAIVRGGEALLHYTPDQWMRHGARIPGEVLALPTWPPKEGAKWLQAVKGSRTDETLSRVVWKSAGWVPAPGSENSGVPPVFIVGTQAIGAEDDEVLSGLNEQTLAGATKFGFDDDPRDLDDPDYRDAVRADIEEMFAHYVTRGPWTNNSFPAIVIASAIRPVLPLRPRSTIYFVGPKGKGKSWSAKMTMAFWSPRGAFIDSLPGSATDTMASTEYAVSRSPIWVVDDLAPSPDRRSMEKESKALEDIIRGQFNGTSKRRMGPNGTTRERSEPKALLIATAENEPMTGSIRERIISVNVRDGSLSPNEEITDSLNDFASGPTPSRINAAMVKYLRMLATEDTEGWAGLVREISKRREALQGTAAKWLKEFYGETSNPTRAASLVADQLLALVYLARLAKLVGVDGDTASLLTSYDAIGEGGLAGSLVSLVAEGSNDKKEASPGRSLIAALSTVLSSGKAHVKSLDDPARPPMVGVNSNWDNTMLGWTHEGDTMKARGPMIGAVVHKPIPGTAEARTFVVFDVQAAFSEAQRHHPERVQYGVSQATAWSAVWDEGIAVDSSEYGFARVRSKGKPQNPVQIARGKQRYRGVPVELHTLLNGGNPSDENPPVDDSPSIGH